MVGATYIANVGATYIVNVGATYIVIVNTFRAQDSWGSRDA